MNEEECRDLLNRIVIYIKKSMIMYGIVKVERYFFIHIMHIRHLKFDFDTPFSFWLDLWDNKQN